MAGKVMLDESKVKRGYGVVDLSAPWKYKPWIHIREVCSGNGRKHIIGDLKYPERKIHLLSDLELQVYYMLRQNEHVIELFEQYPLDLEKTLCLCEEMNIRHPVNPDTKHYCVMTTDFFALVSIEGKNEYRAYAVKTSSDLKDERILEKLKLEQMYWSALNIPWSVITERNMM